MASSAHENNLRTRIAHPEGEKYKINNHLYVNIHNFLSVGFNYLVLGSR